MQPSFFPSYWEQQSFLKDFDVLVIGSGIVGLNAAITLAEREPSLRIGIVDRSVLPSGASTRNAGFACFGSLSELVADIRAEGFDQAVARVAQRMAGLDMLFARTGKEAIGYRHTGGFEAFLPEDDQRLADCLSHLDALNRALEDILGEAAFREVAGHAGMRGVAHVIAHPVEGHLHPGLMIARLLQIARNARVEVIGGADVVRLDEQDSATEVILATGQKLKARYAIVATNGFTRTLLPGLDVVPARNQVYVTDPLKDLPVRGCYHYNEGYVYFRDVEDRLLIGGARHIDREVEATDHPGLTQSIQKWLMAFTEKHILGYTPQIAYRWSGIMGVGPEKQPIVRMISERIAVAVRLGGMGVAIGTSVGDSVAGLIAQKV